MKPSFCVLAALFLFFTGAMSSPTSAQSDGSPGADGDDDDDDDMALTNDGKKKHAGMFDDVPGIAGGGDCGGEFTSSPFLPSGVEGGAAADCGVIVAGRMTFVDDVCFDQPTVIHVEEELILQSRDMLSTKNLHFNVHTGGKLIIRAPAMCISRDDEVSDWPLLKVSGTVIFEPSGSMQALLDGSLKDEGDVVLIAHEAAVFLSAQDIVRYPSRNAMTVSRMMTDEGAEDGRLVQASPHRDGVKLRPELKPSLAAFRVMSNAESSDGTIKTKNTVSPSTPSVERSDRSTAHPDDHGHQHRDHHPRRQHNEDVDTSGKDYFEPTRPTPTKATPPSHAPSNVPPIGSTPPGASGKGSKAQGSQVRPSTSADKLFFDLSMAWVAVGMLRAHGGMADDFSASSRRRGVEATGRGRASPRSVSGRSSVSNDDENTSGLRRPEPVISFHSGTNRPQLSSRSDISVEGGDRDGLSVVLEKNPEPETTAPSSSSSDTEVVGSNSETDGGKRVSPPIVAAAAAAAVVVRTGEDSDNGSDSNREGRLLRAGNVLGGMRQKKAEVSAVTPEKGRRGTRGWASWRARRDHQGQGEPSAGRRSGEREVALGEKGGLDSTTIDGKKVGPESARHPREQRAAANNKSPGGRSEDTKGTGKTAKNDGVGRKSGGRKIWGITAGDVMD